MLATQSKKKGKHIKKDCLVPEGSNIFILTHKIFYDTIKSLSESKSSFVLIYSKNKKRKIL